MTILDKRWVRDSIFPAEYPRVSLVGLKFVQDIRGMVSKGLEEDSLNATHNLYVSELSSKLY